MRFKIAVPDQNQYLPGNDFPFPLVLLMLILAWNINPLIAQKVHSRRIRDIPVADSGYQRWPLDSTGFGFWLRNLYLKPEGSPVLNYRGKVHKSVRDTTVAAVINLEVQGCRNEQCMDILIRLYATYLWQNQSAGELILPLPGGLWIGWAEWLSGRRPEFYGLQVKLKQKARPDSSSENYKNYLNLVYSESHTQQFYHGLKQIDRHDLQIGDFIVSRGSKGHAVMIVDLARDKQGRLLALIGHGDTPACEFYLLNYRAGNPWFPLNFEQEKLPLAIKRVMKWEGLRRFMLRKK
jgi:hypothetical protein